MAWPAMASEGGFGSDTIAGGLWPGGNGHDTVTEAMLSDLGQDRDQGAGSHWWRPLTDTVCDDVDSGVTQSGGATGAPAAWPAGLSKYTGPRRSRCRALRKPPTASVPGAAALVRSTVPHLCTLASHVKTNTLRPRSSQVRKAPYRELATKGPRGWPAEQWQSMVSWRNLETQ